MKRFAIITALLGLTLFTVLVAHSGFDDVANAVRSAGWATLLVVLARAVAVAFAGLAWRLLFPARQRLSAGISVLIRFIREAVNQLLPVGQVGGDVVGARLATFWGGEGALAGAVTIADVAIQAATQFVFAIAGIAVLVALQGDGEIVRYALVGVLVGAAGIAAFFLLQGRFGSRIMTAIVRRLGGEDGKGRGMVERLWGRLGTVYSSRSRLARSTALHMGVWLFGTVEVYVALHAMGFPVTWAEALVVESLGQAVRGAAFAVPGGLGVQEGGYVALCALFGIPPGPALALSLLKRVADLVLGLPFLAVWQVIEGRRALGLGAIPEAEPTGGRAG